MNFLVNYFQHYNFIQMKKSNKKCEDNPKVILEKISKNNFYVPQSNSNKFWDTYKDLNNNMIVNNKLRNT